MPRRGAPGTSERSTLPEGLCPSLLTRFLVTPRARGRIARTWSALTSTQRRRILLGSLVVVSLAARDLLLFCTSAGLWGLVEMAPRARAAHRAAA
jgi:hypothetical protein